MKSPGVRKVLAQLESRGTKRRERRAGGRGLYGAPDHDSQAFAARYAKVPLGGFFCNGEIGPVHGRTFLHGYTSSFGLFRDAP